jgi:hypothetical protein
MRLSVLLPAVLVICLTTIAIAVPASPTLAECHLWDIELSPQSGPPGTELEIYGHHFLPNRHVDIYYDDDRIIEGFQTDANGEFTVTFAVPEGCTGYYWVSAEVGSEGGFDRADKQFAVKPGLTVSPDKGPAGSTVTVQGRGFAKNEQGIELMYYPNGSYETIERTITANADGSWERTLQIPSSTRGEHKIDAEGFESSLYKVQDAIFTVTGDISLDKASGIVGDTIIMTGNTFAAREQGITILFGDEAVATDISANSDGEWQASFQIPEIPGGEYPVTAEGEYTRKEDIGELSFQIVPDIVLSACEVHVGMELTVAGRGFVAGDDVDIMYDGCVVTRAAADDQGCFETSFSVPASNCGEHEITAGCSAENAANAALDMESTPPPVPALISPADRSRLGFMGDVMPVFEWSQVSDVSGVSSYRLRIATSDDFSTPSIVASVTDLTAVSYNLTQSLSQGTYYWTVQAVDGAENEGQWSPASSFRVGLLPLWGIILIIVAAVVLLAFLIRALIIRRVMYSDRW